MTTGEHPGELRRAARAVVAGLVLGIVAYAVYLALGAVP